MKVERVTIDGTTLGVKLSKIKLSKFDECIELPHATGLRMIRWRTWCWRIVVHLEARTVSELASSRHKTAIARHELSKPLQRAIDDNVIQDCTAVFDYGCGRGGDLQHLAKRGIRCSGWDPRFRPDEDLVSADVVNLGYVVNVIEDPIERLEALRAAWDLAKEVLIVSARLTYEIKYVKHSAYGDGYVTSRGTFQKFYEQGELRDWIDQSLGVNSMSAGPGIFYAFKSEGLHQTVAASRYRRRSTTPTVPKSAKLYQENRKLLEPLVRFLGDRGRLPDDTELAETEAICNALGSLRRAESIVRKATGKSQWDDLRNIRSQDLLVYLALARFPERPSFSGLPSGIRLDVKAFFSTYKRACKEADDLLFSAGSMNTVSQACSVSRVGKLTHDALYIHVSAVEDMPHLLRVYEGCARNYLGVVEEATVIKLNRLKPKVSYLSYPDFDSNPHPALMAALVVNLQTFEVKHWNHTESENPTILHRKETFVGAGYPGREKFARLTAQEERAGLFENSHHIGHAEEWDAILRKKALQLRGHQLRKVRPFDP